MISLRHYFRRESYLITTLFRIPIHDCIRIIQPKPIIMFESNRTFSLRFALSLALIILVSSRTYSDELTRNYPGAQLEQRTSIDYSREASSGWSNKPGWEYSTEAVAAANPLATRAGLQILEKGGNAVDAAVAIQMVLTLVEPQSSGIGGGGFLVLSHAGRVVVFDGRESAPSRATEKLFTRDDGKLLDFKTAQLSSRSIGVPGVVSMLWEAHHHYGKLPWADLIRPATQLADSGFPISPRLFQLIQRDTDLLRNAYAREYFYQSDSTPWPVGHVLKNPELSKILKDIGRFGSKAFYLGKWANATVDAANNRGKLTSVNFDSSEVMMNADDLKNYKALIREPLCFEVGINAPNDLEGLYKVCGAPPPASGTLAMAQIFGMLEKTPVQGLPFGPEWLHYYTEASRLALADRDKYVYDSGCSNQTRQTKNTNCIEESKTWRALIDPEYLGERARLIGDQKMQTPNFGIPPGLEQSSVIQKMGSMPYQPEHGTSHMSVIDRYGNAVAFTSSVESAFGSHRMVNSGEGLMGGFLLNSQLTDFSFAAEDSLGNPIANRPGPGKRPRSSMSPTIVLKLSSVKGTHKLTHPMPRPEIFASLGSPGGNAIIHFTSQTLWALLNWNMSPQEAINLGHFSINKPNGELILEQNLFSEDWLNSLKERGQAFTEAPLTSGVQAIERKQSRLIGGADPRREGIVLGR